MGFGSEWENVVAFTVCVCVRLKMKRGPSTVTSFLRLTGRQVAGLDDEGALYPTQYRGNEAGAARREVRWGGVEWGV